MNFISSFAGKDGLPALITVVAIIMILMFAVKKGWVSFRGHGLEVGAADSEAKIRNMQQVYAKSLFEGTLNDLPQECEYYHSRFIISQCLDEVERMIRENHITSDKCYIDTEFQIIYGIILKYTTLDYFRSTDFKNYLLDLIEKLVSQLEKIRKTYS